LKVITVFTGMPLLLTRSEVTRSTYVTSLYGAAAGQVLFTGATAAAREQCIG
jgi:hypothetical protein